MNSMKKYFFTLLCVIAFFKVNSQNQNNSEEKFDYEFKGFIKLKKLNKEPTPKDTTWTAERFRFNIVAEESAQFGDTEFDYVVFDLVNFPSKFRYVKTKRDTLKTVRLINKLNVKAINQEIELKAALTDSLSILVSPNVFNQEEYLDYTKKVKSVNNFFETKVIKLKNQLSVSIDSLLADSNEISGIEVLNKSKDTIQYRSYYVDIDDQNIKFWMKKDKFDKYLENGYIAKRYERKYQFAYGASLAVPFKIRPETKGQNIKITPELSLGGYAGGRVRLNKYKPIYLYIPIVTAGVTTIGINSNNVIDETIIMADPNSNVDDALVFARTFSVGTFIEFNSFQMGFVLGWDRPGGEVARDWIYNDRLWYSFSIGYNFLRREDTK